MAESTTATDVYNATLVERQNLSDELAIVRIRPDVGRVPAFEPGQFCTVGLPKDDGPSPTGKPRLVRRAYSIASSPLEQEALELYIALVEKGKLTTRLWELQVGDRLFLDPRINGHFTLEAIPEGKDLVLVSTGTGLAPFVSMLRTYRGKGRWRRCVMLHGVRYVRDLGYRAELEQAAADDASVVYLPCVTREPVDSDWAGHRGRVNELLTPEAYVAATGDKLDPKQCHVLLCGNPAMIQTVQLQLEPLGFVESKKDQPGNLHFERYW